MYSLLPLSLESPVNITVMAVWNALDPLRWTREVTEFNIYEQATESEGSCWAVHDDISMQVVYVSILGAVNIGIMFLALYQAYKARHIHLEFAESEYISKALSTSALVCLIGIPVMFLASNDYATSFFVLAR